MSSAARALRSLPEAHNLFGLVLHGMKNLLLEARVGIEPTNKGFPDPGLISLSARIFSSLETDDFDVGSSLSQDAATAPSRVLRFSLTELEQRMPFMHRA
jgi:hypothetical protein